MNQSVVLLSVAAVVLAVALTFVVMALGSHIPRDCAPVDGRLSACGSRPNCVSSASSVERARIDPLPTAGSPADTMIHLRTVLEGLPRTRIVTATDSYLHATSETRLMRFVDDVEFLLRPEHVEVRSASRSGYSDRGVNRRRLDEIRRRYQALLAPSSP